VNGLLGDRQRLLRVGVKGVGEGGAVVSPAAIASATRLLGSSWSSIPPY
jgi:CO/xanthine dehydrogenase Mo-binding subunit